MALIFVDQQKSQRADEIVSLLTNVTPKTREQEVLKEKFGLLVAEAKVKEGDFKEFVYTKLGGLVRTEEEHKVAVAKAKEIKKGYDKKKKKVDEDEE